MIEVSSTDEVTCISSGSDQEDVGLSRVFTPTNHPPPSSSSRLAECVTCVRGGDWMLIFG